MIRKRLLGFCVAVVTALLLGSAADDAQAAVPSPELLTSGLAGGSGSTVGPDGALYVTEGDTGKVLRVDPDTGAMTTFASGLPPALISGLGGAIDLTFRNATAYVLVTLVGSDIGGSSIVGIYRVDGPSQFTVIADIGSWAIQNPPQTAFDVPTGLQFAIEPYRNGFLVTDGHHNRVLQVTLDGAISEFAAFDNIVPTGLARMGNNVFMAEAGPVPHLPEDGKVVLLHADAPASEIASGASLLVDVEFGAGGVLYALSQGVFGGGPPASPALPDTGSLLRVNWDGSLTEIIGELDRPTSLEFIGHRAYVVTLDGEIWTIDLRRQR
jgi:sugar lactone lactonase YvrE